MCQMLRGQQLGGGTGEEDAELESLQPAGRDREIPADSFLVLKSSQAGSSWDAPHSS